MLITIFSYIPIGFIINISPYQITSYNRWKLLSILQIPHLLIPIRYCRPRVINMAISLIWLRNSKGTTILPTEVNSALYKRGSSNSHFKINSQQPMMHLRTSTCKVPCKLSFFPDSLIPMNSVKLIRTKTIVWQIFICEAKI